MKKLLFTPSQLAVRESQDPAKPSRTIEGCAIVFDRETTLYEDGPYRECEVISRDCITPDFLLQQDIKLNMLHDRELTIARCNKGAGNLQLDLREDGLYFSVEAPECDLGDRALALVRSGVISGCSFEFFAKDYSIDKRGDEDYLVTHRSFDRVTALTLAMDPAYPQTSVNAREQADALKREYEDLNANERRLKEQEDQEREARHLLAMREAERAAERRRIIDAVTI